VKILAIDLGHTIGYACLWDHALSLHGTVPLGQAYSIKALVPAVDLVVIERPAYRERPDVQERYEAEIHSLRVLYAAVEVKVIRPADWMPRFGHHPLPERGVLKTQHEKDAYRMTRWAQDKFGGQK
jgi:hypothetical protein